MAKLSDLSGQHFGRLVVLRRHPQNTRAAKARWICQCDCGNETVAVGSSLKTGHTTSCGCAHREHLASGDASRTHSLSQTPEYRRWKAMLTRCYNPRNMSYSRYGGRGITVCDRWRSSFPAFLEDMGPLPSLSHSIERMNVDLGYSPENCRWATPVEQARNTSRNRLITWQSETRPLSEWCERLGLRYSAVLARIDRYGWPIEDALTRPVGKKERATHCRRGHPYTEENTYEHRGRRSCMACRRESALIQRRARGVVPLGERTHCRRGHLYTEATTYRWPGRNMRTCRVCAAQTARERRRKLRI